MVKVEEARLDGADVCARRVATLVREWLVDDADQRASIYGDADHVGHILNISFCKCLGAIDGVNPDGKVVRLTILSVCSRFELDRR